MAVERRIHRGSGWTEPERASLMDYEIPGSRYIIFKDGYCISDILQDNSGVYILDNDSEYMRSCTRICTL